MDWLAFPSTSVDTSESIPIPLVFTLK
jgi:hypothetical protein